MGVLLRDLRASDTADMKVVLRASRMTSDLAKMMCELLVGLARASSVEGWLEGYTCCCNRCWFEGWLQGGVLC